MAGLYLPTSRGLPAPHPIAVTERVEDRYLGLLRNQPFAYDPDDEDVYLRWGAEVAFGPEHVIDINDDAPVSEEDLARFTRRWSR